jgi:hypothetical protein
MSNKEIIHNMLVEKFDEFSYPFHIIVLIEESERDGLALPLYEGRWEDSGRKDYWLRLDLPRNDFEQLHAHIAHKKNINTKSKQVSWNQDGTRHDKKSFNNSFNGMETAKTIARDALGLPPDAVLEFVDNKDTGELLLESIENLPESGNVFIFRIVKDKKKQVLKG